MRVWGVAAAAQCYWFGAEVCTEVVPLSGRSPSLSGPHCWSGCDSTAGCRRDLSGRSLPVRHFQGRLHSLTCQEMARFDHGHCLTDALPQTSSPCGGGAPQVAPCKMAAARTPLCNFHGRADPRPCHKVHLYTIREGAGEGGLHRQHRHDVSGGMGNGEDAQWSKLPPAAAQIERLPPPSPISPP